MTIVTTITSRAVLGNMRMVTGTYSDTDSSGNAGAGGEVPTGLNSVDFFTVMHNKRVGDSTADSSGNAHPTTDETFPTSSGTITLLYDSSGNGNWMAYGK